MSRAPLPSASPEAAVRAHFGLSQQQLARYLGVSVGFVSHLEAGRKPQPLAVALRLLVLARLLPPPLGSGPPIATAPAPGIGPLDLALGLVPAETTSWPALVRRRVRRCCQQALVVAQRLATLQARAAAFAHRRRGLAQLGAAPSAPSEATRYAHGLRELAQDLALADPDPAAAATAQQLLAARLAGLRTEVAALAGPSPA